MQYFVTYMDFSSPIKLWQKELTGLHNMSCSFEHFHNTGNPAVCYNCDLFLSKYYKKSQKSGLSISMTLEHIFLLHALSAEQTTVL